MGDDISWLTPTKQNEQNEVEETEIVQYLISLIRSLKVEIAKHEKAKQAADDTGKFGTYRYEAGFIHGLKEACDFINDKLMNEWGM